MTTVWMIGISGCIHTADLHTQMSKAVTPNEGVQQVQLAHIGHVETADGRFEVAVQQLVLTGMLAPRGQAHLLLFTTDGSLVARYRLPMVKPLWCEGGKVYLAGNGIVPGIVVDPALVAAAVDDDMPVGNVIDFSRGLRSAQIVRESRYGSSGGIED